MLGIPTVADRIAQTVVAMFLEPLVEPHFHPDSYGYRPKKSALQAVGSSTRKMLALRLGNRPRHPAAFMTIIDHALIMRAVGKYTDSVGG